MNQNNENLAAGRKAACELYLAVLASERDENVAARCLLDLAVYTAKLLEEVAIVLPDAFSEASKDHRFFPVLLAAKNGGDTKQKLTRVENLPIAENLPFKRICGKLRWDLFRRWIEGCYNYFQRVRRHEADVPSPLEFLKAICALPELRKDSARQWAAVMARITMASTGSASLVASFRIDLLKETGKKKRRKETRLRARYGGIRLDVAQEHSERDCMNTQGAKNARFFIRSENIALGREVDFIEAAGFDQKFKQMHLTPQTYSDKVNAVADAIEKRLLSMLK